MNCSRQEFNIDHTYAERRGKASERNRENHVIFRIRVPFNCGVDTFQQTSVEVKHYGILEGDRLKNYIIMQGFVLFMILLPELHVGVPYQQPLLIVEAVRDRPNSVKRGLIVSKEA